MRTQWSAYSGQRSEGSIGVFGNNPRASGFSLLELLAVMAILGILSTMAVTGYFSAIRGMVQQRAITGVTNALVLARQRACTDAVKTSVVCFNVWSGGEQGKNGLEKWKACTPTYVVCKAIGQFTSVNGDELGDEFAPLDRMFSVSDTFPNTTALAPIRLYNLTRGGWSDVYATAVRKAYPGATFEYPATAPIAANTAPKILLCLKAKKTVNMGGGWKVGDSYGVAVTPIATLPKAIYFGPNSSGTGSLSPDASSGTAASPPMMLFTFYPDGHSDSGYVELYSLEPDLKRFRTIRLNEHGAVTNTN